MSFIFEIVATPVVAQQTYAAAPAFTAHSTYSAPAYAHSTYAAAPALAVAPAVKTYAAARKFVKKVLRCSLF